MGLMEKASPYAVPVIGQMVGRYFVTLVDDFDKPQYVAGTPVLKRVGTYINTLGGLGLMGLGIMATQKSDVSDFEQAAGLGLISAGANMVSKWIEYIREPDVFTLPTGEKQTFGGDLSSQGLGEMYPRGVGFSGFGEFNTPGLPEVSPLPEMASATARPWLSRIEQTTAAGMGVSYRPQI